MSGEAPYGATVVVVQQGADGPRFLMLHRRHHGPDFEGDWAWGPPSGARYPGEEIHRCAERELHEETGLRLTLRPVRAGPRSWSVFVTEAPVNAEVRLSAEHDRWRWLPLDRAIALAMPDVVRRQLVAAAGAIRPAADREEP